MLSTKVKIDFDLLKLQKIYKRSLKRPLSRTGAYLRGVAQQSIAYRKSRSSSSETGKPPRTHVPKGKTKGLKNSIQFAYSDSDVVIGPTRTGVGLVGKTHEFGGVEKRSVSKRTPKWKLFLGGYGPIRLGWTGEATYAKLKTHEMVSRAIKLAREIIARNRLADSAKDRKKLIDALQRERKLGSKAKYPKRPFMGPSLSIGEKKIPEFFRCFLEN